MMRPSSSTQIRSASLMVEMRCETISVVRPRADVAEIVKDLFLGVSVDGRERIVEDQDPRIAHNGTCDRRPLLLPAGKRDAAFADKLFVLFRE